VKYISICSNPDRGNAYFLKTPQTNLIIDAGFTKQGIIQFLHFSGISPEEVDAIILTHNHQIHTKGLKFILDLNPNIPVYGPKNVFTSVRFPIKNKVIVKAKNTFWFKDVFVNPIWVKHGTETLNYTFQVGSEKLAYVTNTGNIEKTMIDEIGICQHFIVESHYHPGIARKYGQWAELQHIVTTDGHLSNEDASEIVARCSDESLQSVLISNISKFNDPNLPIVIMYSVICDQDIDMLVAPGDHFGTWLGKIETPNTQQNGVSSQGLVTLIESLSPEQQQDIFSKLINL
jgi:metal-dependent hydrolase (beta-lactamase superfamily II)